MFFLSKWVIFRFHVSFLGCIRVDSHWLGGNQDWFGGDWWLLELKKGGPHVKGYGKISSPKDMGIQKNMKMPVP